MTNDEWVNKFGVPESINGISVDWSSYIPPGGWEWQDHFQNGLLIGLNESIAALDKEKAKYEHAKRDYDALLAGAEKTEKFVNDFKAAIKNYPESMSCFGDRADPFFKEWLSLGGNMIHVIKSELSNMTMDADYIRKLDVDRAFLDALKNYFLKDFEFDMMMWAMDNSDKRYFKKLFRTNYRLLKQVSGFRYVVENTTSDVAISVRKAFEQPLKALHTCYVNLEPLLRQFKKVVSDPDFMPAQTSQFTINEAEYRNKNHGWTLVNNIKFS